MEQKENNTLNGVFFSKFNSQRPDGGSLVGAITDMLSK